MTKMIVLQLIFLTYFALTQKFVISSAAACVPKVVLHNCNRNFENTTQWIWRRDRRYQISSTVQPGCQSSDLTYTWTIQNFSVGANDGKRLTQFNNRPQFILDYYALGTGSYVLSVTVTETQQTDRDQCLITIRPEMPVPVILGGNLRVVPSGKPFLVDGKSSINYDVSPAQEASLYYTWACVSHTNPDDQFCAQEDLSQRNSVLMRAAEDGERFTVYLNVATEHSPWIQTEQEIIIQDEAYQINIECVRNCRNSINYRSTIYLEAFCEDCPKNEYTWTMNPSTGNKREKIDFDSETVYGSRHWKLIIKEEVLVPGDEYQFVVTYGKSYAYEKLKVAKLPQMNEECDITPTNGISLETLFQISCQGIVHTEPVTYKLYQNDSNAIQLSSSDDGLFALHLPISAKNLIVKIEDPNGLYIVKSLAVMVEASDKSVNDYTDTMNQIKTSGNFERAVHFSYIMSEEAKLITDTSEHSDNLKKELKKTIIEDLKQVPLKTQDDIAQVAAVNKNLWGIQTSYDREFEKLSVQLSAKIVENQVKLLKEAPYPSVFQLDTSQAIQPLVWVANSSLQPKFDDLIIDDILVELTTPEYQLTYPTVTEDYPIYHDADLNYLNKLRDHKEITKSAIDVLTQAGLSVGMTLLPGEPMYQTNSPITINVLTGSGRLLAHKIVGDSHSGFLIVGSPNLANHPKTFGVVTAYPRNPYWWNEDRGNVSTIVLNANYYNDKQQIINTDKPLQLLFEANWTDPPIFRTIITVPSLDGWDSKTMDKHISVHRIDVKEGGALIVDFYHLKEDTFDVVVTYNRRPQLADFTNMTVINKTNSWKMFSFPLELRGYGDSWFYIGILPNKQMIENRVGKTSFTYEVSFVTPICSYWSTNLEQWISSECHTGELTNKEQIHCYCTHHSSYVGSYLNPRNKLDPFREIKFVLQVQVNNLIGIFVLTIILLYCVVLIFAIKVPLYKDRNVLFLPDNVNEEEYAYLVTVKTGSQLFAGTSSNISLIIYGLKGCSKAHLINYPDPNKKLLQRGNEDWFVLTTRECLGELDYIWLWFDSVGNRPSWYCEWVRIVDLQTGQDWFFDVQALLSVMDDGYCRVAVDPSLKVQQSGWVKFLSRHAWNITQPPIGNLQYKERVTIILSIILTTFTLTLFLHNPPSLKLSYGLGYGRYCFRPILLVVSVLSGLISFGINRIFLLLFSRTTYYKLTWAGLIITILFNLTYLILLGFWISNVTALMWLTSTLGALFQIVLLLENLDTWMRGEHPKTVIGQLFGGTVIYLRQPIIFDQSQSRIGVPQKFRTSELTLREESSIDLEDIRSEARRQKEKLQEVFDEALLRPYFTSKYRALTVEEWKVKREREIERRNLATLIQDLAMFVLYILLLYLVVLVGRDSYIVYGNESMKNLMVTEEFEDMVTINDVYQYVDESLIPTVHSVNWYGSWTAIEPGLLADFSTKILGVVRMRQLRVNETCKFSKIFQGEILCRPEYAVGHNDVSEYMEFWQPLVHMAVPRLANAWRYQVDGMKIFGFMETYPDGGFGALLGRTKHNSYYNLQYLEETQWITGRTRAVIIEFLTYNANYNIFHIVSLIVENSATGFLTTSSNILTMRLLFVKQEFQIMIAVEAIAFTTMTLIMLLKNVAVAKKNWSSYIGSKWNVVDAIIIAMSLVCVGIYYHRSRMVGELLDQLERAKHNQFLSYFHLVSMEYFVTVLGAVLVFVATVRLWKFLRFIAAFRIVERTFQMSAIYFIGLWFCHCTLLVMYTIVGAIFFGSQLEDFHTFSTTFRTLTLLSIGLHQDFDFMHLIDVGGLLAIVYFLSYTVMVLIIYNMYVSLLVLCYTDSETHFSNLHDSHAIRRYLSEECGYYSAMGQRYIWNFRLEGGDDRQIRKVTPKSNEHRYANVLTLSEQKLIAMTIVAKTFLLSRGHEERSLELITNLLYYVLSKDKEDDNKMLAFFHQNNDGTELVADYRLLQMEYAANYITDRGIEEDSHIETFEPKIKGSTEDTIIDQLNDILKALKMFQRIFNNITVVSKKPQCNCRCKKEWNCYMLQVRDKFLNSFFCIVIVGRDLRTVDFPSYRFVTSNYPWENFA